MIIGSRVVRAAFAGAVVVLGFVLTVPAAFAQQGGRSMWWNDNGVVVRLKLTSETRTQMDQVYALLKPALEEVGTGRLRAQFHQALNEGNWKAADAALTAWAAAEQRKTRLGGDLKIGVLSLLSAEQVEIFRASGGANIVRSNWKPKVHWPIRFQQQSP